VLVSIANRRDTGEVRDQRPATAGHDTQIKFIHPLERLGQPDQRKRRAGAGSVMADEKDARAAGRFGRRGGVSVSKQAVERHRSHERKGKRECQCQFSRVAP
jgi:hypothetical protein